MISLATIQQHLRTEKENQKLCYPDFDMFISSKISFYSKNLVTRFYKNQSEPCGLFREAENVPIYVKKNMA
jgi:hypothetical protein